MEGIKKIKHVLELVKFSHSVFALPFALASALLANFGYPPIKTVLLIIMAMVTARNTAMAFNRLIDADIDAKNPRTASRHIPSGLLSKQFVILFILANILLFILSSYWLNRMSFLLSPIALIIICFYSITKRFTDLTQIFLGLALGIAPIAAAIAVTGQIKAFACLMGSGVLFWVAGFDILYSTQDVEFDKKSKLKSLVVRLGVPRALQAARFFHLIAFLFFAFTGFYLGLSWIYFSTVILMGAALFYEHTLVSQDDLSKINAAFFNVNGFIGILYLAGTLLEIYSRSRV